jgi:hypothetical protein
MTSVLMSVVATLSGLVRSRAALHLVLALGHQLQVLERTRPRRVRLTKPNRWFWTVFVAPSSRVDRH